MLRAYGWCSARRSLPGHRGCHYHLLFPATTLRTHRSADYIFSASLVLVLTPLTILGAAVGALGAIHTVRRSYVAPAAVLACEPIVKIALMATLGSSLGAYALALKNLIGAGAAVAILWALLERSGFQFGYDFLTGRPSSSRFFQ